MIYLIFDPSTSLKRLVVKDDRRFSRDELKEITVKHLENIFGYETFDFYLLHNGKPCSDVEEGEVHVIPRILGGKGGFGSMLRAIGAQIEKTTNREACRDLSGRRLRDINEEKRLKKWIAEQAEREQEALKKKKKKLEKLTEIVNHDFKDEDYTKARLEMPEKIHESVEEGLKAVVEPSKSNNTECKKSKPTKKKKVKGRLWLDDLASEESELSCDSEEEPSPKKKKLS